MSENQINIKAIIGLGNPGAKYYNTRHNIGFRVLDMLCTQFECQWQHNDKMEYAQINLNDKNILLIKPQTFMNSSGQVIPFLKKKNIEPNNLIVIHDELELPFGEIKLKFDGSAKGHNGLKSIISAFGSNFYRLRIGISRPEDRNEVPNYVLNQFSDKEQRQIDYILQKAVDEIKKIV